MTTTWEYYETPPAVLTKVSCAPIEPGTLVVVANDGVNDKTLYDQGDGTLLGDGVGLIHYDQGHVGIEFSNPQPISGTPILADYDSVEGGCPVSCTKCASNYVKLSVTPGTISGAGEFAITNAWDRLFKKIQRDIMPIYVRVMPEVISEFYRVDVVYRFDIVSADGSILDTSGLHAIMDDTSW